MAADIFCRRLAAGRVLVTAVLLTLAGLLFPTGGSARRPAWSIQPTPSAGDFSALSGVSCPSRRFCMTVGFTGTVGFFPDALAETWDGTAWSIRPTDFNGGPKGSALQAVSCSSPNACMVVGYANASGGAQEIRAERWDGTRFAAQNAPNPDRAIRASLAGVSCPSATSCTAVGQSTDIAGPQSMLADVWNGATWQIQPTPDPPNGQSPALSAVSCTATDACIAVGSYTDNEGSQPLAEVWDGTSWQIQPIPEPGISPTVLQDVSCLSRRSCTAVGSSTSSSGGVTVTLAEHWNGSTWHVQETSNRSGAVLSVLSGVSCVSRSACTAVGYDSTTGLSGSERPLIEHWNGRRWSVQPAPTPSDIGSEVQAVLAAVSCSSRRACTAVGSASSHAIAERYACPSARTATRARRYRFRGVSERCAGRRALPLRR